MDPSRNPPSGAASPAEGGRPPAISVVIVARNEAGNLPRCLESVKGWTAESIVALNKTTDDSAAIAAKFGARVVNLPWQGFRDTKNAALELAAHPWALCLDADEEVSPALRAEITAFLHRSDLERFDGARFPRKVWFIDRWIMHGDWYPDFNVRLCRRGRAHWGGDAFVHERIVCDGPVATLRGDLHHFSFPTISSQVAKINPFADLYLRQQLEKGCRFYLGAAVFRPGWRFFRAYVLRLGFLDGYPGLYIAWANAFSAMVRQSRLYEAERRKDVPCPTNRDHSANLPRN
ncbi:MAG: glycosyltransferase family 2 protein [Opitutaceae bacterium]|jgi:glycosyltransferase involved in cell wall biosynthesis